MQVSPVLWERVLMVLPVLAHFIAAKPAARLVHSLVAAQLHKLAELLLWQLAGRERWWQVPRQVLESRGSSQMRNRRSS